MRARVFLCVRACVRAYVRACVQRACVRACVRVCVCVCVNERKENDKSVCRTKEVGFQVLLMEKLEGFLFKLMHVFAV